MIARNFKAVGWVAAIGIAALICYMFSLKVAAERADLAKLDRQIAQVQQSIATLNTELGTRGRVAQLQHWASNDFGFQAPGASQFVGDEVALARLDVRAEAPIEQSVRQAAADAPAPVQSQAARVIQASNEPSSRRGEGDDRPLLHRASLDRSEPAVPAVPAASRRAPARDKPERAPARVERPVRIASADRDTGNRAARRTERRN